MNRFPLIGFMGVTGVGKTTQAKEFVRRNKQFTLLDENEAAETNKFLALSYQDPEHYSFHSQVHFLLSKAEQLLWALEARTHTPIVQEPVIYEDAEMYAQARLWGEELRLYQRIYKNILPVLPRPDLIVYLRADVGEIVKRIEERAKKAPKEERDFREKELLAPRSYWEALHELHEKWAGKNDNEFQILVVETGSRSIKEVADEVSRKAAGLLNSTFPRLHL